MGEGVNILINDCKNGSLCWPGGYISAFNNHTIWVGIKYTDARLTYSKVLIFLPDKKFWF